MIPVGLILDQQVSMNYLMKNTTMKNLLIYCLILLSPNSQAQKYKGWYLGFTAGVGNAYYHNKNFNYYIDNKGNLDENDFYYGVIYKRADKLLNSFHVNTDIQHHLKNGYHISFGVGYAFQKSIYHMGTNNSGQATWYPSELHMDEFE